MLTKRMEENLRKQEIEFNGYANAEIDVEKSVILRMYLNNEPIEKISKYLDIESDIVQESIDKAKKGGASI